MDVPIERLREISRNRRLQIWDMLYAAGGSGHWGGTSSWVDASTGFWKTDREWKEGKSGILRYNPEDPIWPERDRVVISKGHGYLPQAVAMSDIGYIPEEELRKLRKVDMDSPPGETRYLQGHPKIRPEWGIEAPSGSLGVGLAHGVFRAIALKKRGIDSKVVVLLGDGEMQEGIVSEALREIAYLKLNNMMIVLDNNEIQNDTFVRERSFYPTRIKGMLEDYGYNVIGDVVPFEERDGYHDGHDHEKIHYRLSKGMDSDRPAFITLNTVKGYGISFTENNPAWHGKGPSPADETQYMEGRRQLEEAA
ncbi:MAG: 1-deoxy-D-xylulose-5-phosphate synthase N-terminal domain-containing protein [Candidatus Aenigmatarchaeota archaeon]|nr:hypothetical protein [Nanoarchaeota archaeon]